VNLTLRPVRVGTDYDEDGCLVFADDRLVAVLVRLSEHHGDYENGYGRLDGPDHPNFPNLDAAQTYITSRLAKVPNTSLKA
jgi:hypothetical protein